MPDPRGPERTIARVLENRREAPEGIVVTVRLLLSCGHIANPNPIYAYRDGDPYRCLACLKEGADS